MYYPLTALEEFVFGGYPFTGGFFKTDPLNTLFMKSIIDAIRSASRITVKPSTVILRLPEDFPVSDLSGFGFYCSGELYAHHLYLHCDLKGFLVSLCVAVDTRDLKVIRYEKPKAR